jgi:hypothetical protein
VDGQPGGEGWPVKLSFPDHLSWLALRRVRRGGVAKLGECYLDGGQPLGILLAELLALLLEEGLLDVAEPGPADGLARVSLTEAGQAHYRSLCQRQRAPLPVPSPEFGGDRRG